MAGRSVESVEQFAQLMRAGNLEIPLDHACILIAQVMNQCVVAEEVVASLDEIAHEHRGQDIEDLMVSLFNPDQFMGNTVAYGDPRNSFLDQVLERKIGIPISLSVLAIVVSGRLGLELVGIGMPGHFLCGTVRRQDNEPSYFDPFHGGQKLNAKDCSELYGRLTGLDNWSNEYLGVTGSRQIVSRMLYNLKSTYLRQGNIKGLRLIMRLLTAIPELTVAESRDFKHIVRMSN